MPDVRPMHVTPTSPRFFVALLPPQAIQAYATEVIQALRDRYHTDTAKAPPHITLQPPFQWLLTRMADLEGCLAQVAHQSSPVPMVLSGFGAFAPRVLYINVLNTPELLALQSTLMTTLERVLAISDARSKQRPFTPHLTIASRNVTRQTFKQAWDDLQQRSVESSVEWTFVSDRLTLLMHDGHRWHIHSEFSMHP